MTGIPLATAPGGRSFWPRLFEQPYFIPAVLLLFGFLAYANGLTGGLMVDDRINLIGQKGIEHKGFIEIFLTKHGDYYRPVANVLIWIFFQLFHKQVVYYHVCNLLVLWASACMVFAIIRRLSGDRRLAFLAASFYMIHPTHALLVAYVVGTTSSAIVVCSQLCFLLFLIAEEKKSAPWYAASLIMLALSFLAHEMAVVVMVPVVAYLYFMRREGPVRIFLKVWPFFLVCAVYFFFRIKFSPTYQIGFGVTSAMHDPARYFVTLMDLIGWYIAKMFYPDRIICLYSTLFSADHLFLKAGIFAAVAGSCAYLVFFRWKHGLYAFALSIFLIGLAPSLAACYSYHPVIQPFIEFHWFALTSMGFYILISAAILALARHSRATAAVAVIAIWAMLLSLAWKYNPHWKNEETFCRYWLTVSDGNLTPYWGLGHALMEKGDYRGAIDEFIEGIRRLKTNNVYLLADAGHCLDVLGDDKNSAVFFKAAIQEDAGYALTYHYVGLYYLKRSRPDVAQAAFKRSLELDPRGSPSWEYVKSPGAPSR